MVLSLDLGVLDVRGTSSHLRHAAGSGDQSRVRTESSPKPYAFAGPMPVTSADRKVSTSSAWENSLEHSPQRQ